MAHKLSGLPEDFTQSQTISWPAFRKMILKSQINWFCGCITNHYVTWFLYLFPLSQETWGAPRVEGPRSWLAFSEQHVGTQVLSSAAPGPDGANSYSCSSLNHGMLISREGLNWVHLFTALAHLQCEWNCMQKLWQVTLSCHCCVATLAGRNWHCHQQ